MGDATDWAPKIKQGLPILYTNAIQGIGNMPPRGTCGTCTDGEIKAAVDYIVKNSQATQAEAIKPAVNLPQPTVSLGKKVYGQVCSICHANGQLGAPVVGDKKAWAPIIKKNMDVLVAHTIKGYKNMPARGACYQCSDTDLIAAVIYMVNQSQSQGNYDLW
jgi:cytochrome c5